jgi:hypothetical protein
VVAKWLEGFKDVSDSALLRKKVRDSNRKAKLGRRGSAVYQVVERRTRRRLFSDLSNDLDDQDGPVFGQPVHSPCLGSHPFMAQRNPTSFRRADGA